MIKIKGKFFLAAFLAFFSLVFYQPEVLADQVSVKNYQADVAFDSAGNMVQSEDIRYRIRGQVDHLDHRIKFGSANDLTALTVTMRADSADTAFPFVESQSESVGTYKKQEGDNQLQLSVYNTMSKDDEITNYQIHLDQVWKKYGDQAIMNVPFAALPYDLKTVKLTFHFPSDVDPDKTGLVFEGQDDVSLNWPDKRTLEVEAKNLKADDELNMWMYTDASLFSSLTQEGPVSKGQQMVEEMDRYRSDAERRASLERAKIIFTLLALGLLLLLYLYLTLRYKRRISTGRELAAAEPAGYLPPIYLGPLFKKKLPEGQIFWLGLLSLAYQGKLDFQWIKNPSGDLVDVNIEFFSQSAEDPAEDRLLRTLNRASNNGILSLHNFKYGTTSNRKGGPSWNWRRTLSRLKRQSRRGPEEAPYYDMKGTACFRVLLWAYIICLLFAFWTCGHYVWTKGELVWSLAVLAAYFLLVVFFYQKGLPIYSQEGLKEKAVWSAYLKQDAFDQGLGLDANYLYSWFTGNNVSFYKDIEASGNLQSSSLAQSLQAVANKTLKDLDQLI